jgi:high-affinity nickel-transport protein
MDPSALTILAGALLLGLRHGIDWDHVAAILDITGSTSPEARLTPLQAEFEALRLTLMYALGHAFVVTGLGIAAIKFSATIPEPLDAFMDRVVGVTLLLLAGWVFWSLYKHCRGQGEFRLVSRWMLVLGALRRAGDSIQRRFNLPVTERAYTTRYESGAAFTIGMIHGVGAETATQVLLLAAIAATANQSVSLAMLLTFVVGLVVSNLLCAWLAITGFMSVARFKPVYVATGVAFGIFSLIVGALFAAGLGDNLPQLHSLLPPLAVLHS